MKEAEEAEKEAQEIDRAAEEARAAKAKAAKMGKQNSLTTNWRCGEPPLHVQQGPDFGRHCTEQEWATSSHVVMTRRSVGWGPSPDGKFPLPSVGWGPSLSLVDWDHLPSAGWGPSPVLEDWEFYSNPSPELVDGELYSCPSPTSRVDGEYKSFCFPTYGPSAGTAPPLQDGGELPSTIPNGDHCNLSLHPLVEYGLSTSNCTGTGIALTIPNDGEDKDSS